MADFTGVFIDSSPGGAESSNLQLRQSFYDSSYFTNAGSALADIAETDWGDLTSNTENQFPNDHAGCKVSSFGEIFYNRITADPNPVNVGNIVTDATREFVIWNGYFNAVRLDQILATNVEGIAIDGDVPPTMLAPLEELTYTLTVSVGEGPPTIDGTYYYNFEDGYDDLEISVVGSRVLPLPYLFQAGLVEAINWQTKILTSHNGYEQRLRLRNAPRQEFSFTINIPRNQIAQLSSLMYGWRTNNFGVPVSSEARNLDIAETAGATILHASSLYGDFREGGLGLIYESINKYELIEIDSFTDAEITISSGLTNSYTTSAFVMPVRTARLLGDPTRGTSGDWQRLTAKYQSVDNIVIDNEASDLQYKDLDVYVDEPLLINGFVTDVYHNRVDLVDYQYGLVQSYAPWLKTHTKRTVGIQMDSLEDAWNFRKWLNRRAGTFRPFWMPTFETDFTNADSGALTTDLRVLDEGQLGLTTERDDLAIQLNDDSWLFVEITSIDQDGDDYLLITFTESLGIDAEDIALISFLGRKRLSSDTIEIVWKGNRTAQTSLPITEINN